MHNPGGYKKIIKKKREAIFQSIMNLDDKTEKKKYLEMAMDSDTTLYKFFNYKTSEYNTRIWQALIEIPEPSMENAGVRSSLSLR